MSRSRIVESTAARPGASADSLRLLVDRYATVPAPVDEDAQQHAVDQGLDRHVERVEPRECGLDRARRAVGVDLDQRDDGEDEEDHHFGAQQVLLRFGPTARSRGSRSTSSARSRSRQQRSARTSIVRRCSSRTGGYVYLPGDLGQRGHHDDVGEDDRPAVRANRSRAQRARRPRECGPAVRIRAVEVLVGRGHKQHRDERDDQHRRRVDADPADRDDEPERGREE